jgi:hypothetical protein
MNGDAAAASPLDGSNATAMSSVKCGEALGQFFS